MSIIAALASTRDGFVGSDGRKFSSAFWDNGVLITPAHIFQDDFDKTFELYGGNVIGAFCGLLEFDGLTVGKHIEDITGASLVPHINLQPLIKTIQRGLCTRLENINPQEIAFDFRKVDLILMGGRQLSRRDMRIFALRFFPFNDRIQSNMNEVFPDRHSNMYYLFGDDLAVNAARKVFDNNTKTSRDAKFLHKLITESLEAGIRSAGRHVNGPNLACGGIIFTKRTCY